MIRGVLSATVALAVLGAALAPLAARRWPRATCGAACGVTLVMFLGFVALVPTIARGGVVAMTLPWIPALGVEASVRIDGLALLFALLISGIGVLVLAYAPPYLDWDERTGRLLGLLLAFLVAMLGLVVADDAITMFVFWELTSISSFFLIAFDAASAEARTRARQALLVTSGGGLALLVGLLLAALAIPGAGVSVALSSLDAATLGDHPHLTAIVVLIALGAFTKSAQVPFQFWLSGAMVAPTPVSAYLHSATMVNAGIYVLARLNPSLGGSAVWTALLAIVGGLTLLTGALLAIVQRDLKLTLAYATIAVLGALTLLIGIGTATAITAALVLLVAHAAYKATLFLVAGNISHQRGTRDPFAPGGGAGEMPFTAGAAVVAAASMGGVPLLLGFVAKDAMFVAGLDGPWRVIIVGVMLIASGALAAAAWIAGVAPFFRRAVVQRPRRDVPALMLVGPLVLAAAGVALGLAPGVLLEPILGPAAAAIAGAPVALELTAWAGLGGVHGAAFGLGLASLGAGSLLFLLLARRLAAVGRLRAVLERGAGARAFEALLAGLQAAAAWVTRTVQHGRLNGYITVVVLTTVVVVGLPLLGPGSVRADVGGELAPHELVIIGIAGAGAITAAIVRDRLASVAALGTAGFALTFLFALFSGPDLAITQLTVETMLVILLVLLFRRLPRSAARRHASARGLRRLGVALVAGALVTLLLVVTSSPAPVSSEASRAHVQLAEGQSSHNVVNAILVNFRALDTLGEVTVLAIAGVGVLSLLGYWARPRRG